MKLSHYKGGEESRASFPKSKGNDRGTKSTSVTLTAYLHPSWKVLFTMLMATPLPWLS